MQTVKNRTNVKWFLAVALASGLTGSVLTMVHLRAAPMEIPAEKNTSTKPIWKAAKYIPHTVAAYTIRIDPDDVESEKIVVLIGQIMAKVVLPGKSETSIMYGLAYMHLNEEDLQEFPSAMKIAKREKILCDVIDTENTVKGLQQIRIAYAKAHNITLDELIPKDNQNEPQNPTQVNTQ